MKTEQTTIETATMTTNIGIDTITEYGLDIKITDDGIRCGKYFIDASVISEIIKKFSK